ncbi:MAG: DUF551 domain-containing protein [Bacteroidales bacterium]|nr:DUF551 domain-containing protein [Bacteroidales bacterium]
MESNWVLITERQPENAGNYLVTTLIHYTDELNDIYLKEVKTAFYSAFDDEWIVRENEYCLHGEVIAWQKLPKPYGE